MGVILSFAGFGLATGPTVAGFIIQEASWRWIFYINIPLGLIVIAILRLYATKDVLPKVQQKIDFIGTSLLATGLCIFVYTLNEIEVWGIKSLHVWGGLSLGVLLVGSYILRDRKQNVHMIPPHLFQNKAYLYPIKMKIGC